MKTKIILPIITLLILIPLSLRATEPTVLINEIAWMGTQTSANDEWLELYNPTVNEIDLTGWILEATDGSPKINLAGIIPAAGYFLLERTDDETVPAIPADQIYTGSLSNTSEWLKLYDSQNNLIDEIDASASWPGGDNSTKQTLERTNDYNWQTSAASGGTPKAQNSTTTSETEEIPSDEPASESETEVLSAPLSAPTTEAEAKKGDIIFTEIFPNPIGPDTVGEFIEIKNVSAINIDLTNWQIKNAAKQIFTIPAWTMTPQSILVFYRPETKLALNNEKEQIKLYAQSGLIISQVEYKTAPEGQSYQISAGKWSWAEVSPGQENIYQNEILPRAIITGPKEAKVGEIITFDASDSFDPENRQLSFFWDFGDGRTDTGVLVRQIYLQPENYEVKLKVSANQASSTEKLKIKITGEKKEEKNNSGSSTTTGVTTTPMINPKEIPFIFISEFLPNPQGSDDQEFIEIFSNHDKPVNLAGWQLDDAESGNKPYRIPEGTIIKPNQYLAFYKTETKISLNNSNDAVRLMAPDGTLVDYTDYEETKEGVSFVLDEEFNWQPSQTPTPGEINVLQLPTEAKPTPTDTSTPKVLGAQLNADDLPAGQPTNKTKYIFAGISALVVLGAGAALKMKKKN